MNSLSWFLYFADVVGNVQGLLITAAVFAAFVTLFAIAAFSCEQSYGGDKDVAKLAGRFAKVSVVVCTLSALTAALIPTTQTIYLIAGSEAGEAVVTSPEGKEILSDIKDVIKHQLNVLKGNNNE